MHEQNGMQIEFQLPTIEFDIQFEPLENQSLVMQQSQLIFPKVDLVIDKNGIKQLSNPNLQLTKFKIIPSNMTEKQVIGKGAAGVVRRAIYNFDGIDTIVAIKEIAATQKDKRDQMLNDLRTFLTGPQSNYLVTFYGCYYHAGFVKQVIEYMNLGSLKNLTNLVAKQLLFINQYHLAQIFRRILLGLNYIHKVKHQIHRDIKPENILMNDQGEIKITDFGTAKFIENTLGLAGTFTGTTVYMSPQRIQFENKYDYKCDVWSVGLILYELATGKQLPYKNSKNVTMMMLMQKIIGQDPPNLNDTNRSAELKDFAIASLKKAPQARSSVEQLLNHAWIQKYAGKVNMNEFMEGIKNLLTKL